MNKKKLTEQEKIDIKYNLPKVIEGKQYIKRPKKKVRIKHKKTYKKPKAPKKKLEDLEKYKPKDPRFKQ